MERERQRRLSVEGRLADLGGSVPDDDVPPAADLPPTWGPIGSLAEAMMDPAEFSHLLALHDDMLAMDRNRRGEPVRAELPAAVPPRVHFAETSRNVAAPAKSAPNVNVDDLDL